MPLAVARETSVRLIDDAIVGGKLVGIFTQRDASVEEPGQEDLYQIGTATHVHKMFKLPDGSLRLIVQGLARVRLDRVISASPYLRAEVSPAVETTGDEDHLELDALERNIKSNFQQVISLSTLLSDDLPDPHSEYLGSGKTGRLHRVEPDDDHDPGQAGGAPSAQRARPNGSLEPGPD